VIVVLALVALVLFLLLLGSLACCCHCLKGCCKGSKGEGAPTTINCFYPMAAGQQPTLPPQYERL
jgi:hypothetical protein